jgi:CRP-like cAMP-binding protein
LRSRLFKEREMTGAESPAVARYLAKLERRGQLPPEARAAFLALEFRRQTYAMYRDIVRERERPERCCFVEAGLVSRYKTLRNGARQILSFHVPGDMVDLQSALVMISDHGIRTHVPTTVITIDHQDILRLVPSGSTH